MGSYNMTCSVSDASIHPGLEVKLYMVVKTKDQVVYAMGLPFNATYIDYGNYDIKHDVNYVYNMKLLGEYHDLSFVDDEELSDYFKNGVLIDNNKTGWFVVRNDIYEYMKHSMYYNYSSSEPNKMYNTTSDLAEQIKDKFIQIDNVEYDGLISTELEKLDKLVGHVSTNGHMFGLQKLYEIAMDLNSISHISNEYSNEINEYSYKNSVSSSKYKNISYSLSDKDKDTLMNEFVELNLFYISLININKKFFIDCRISGQDDTSYITGIQYIKMGEALLNTHNASVESTSEQYNYIPFAQNFKLSELVEKIRKQQYWYKETKENMLKSLHILTDVISTNKEYILSYNAAVMLGIENLFFFNQPRTDLSIKFINDIGNVNDSI